MLQDTYDNIRNKLRIDPESRWFILFQILRTVLLVTIGRYFSVANTLTDAVRMLKISVTNPGFHMLNVGFLVTLGLSGRDLVIMSIFMILIFAVSILNERGISLREKMHEGNIVLRWLILLVGIFAVLLLGVYGPGFDASQFIYFQF